MFYPKKLVYLVLGFLLLFGFLLVACRDGGETETVEVTRIVEVPVEVTVEGEPVEVEVTRVVEVTGEEGETAVSGVPFEEQWAASAHADASAEAFVHWNEEDPAEVPPECAKCHSTPGFLDFLGADDSEAGVVEHPASIGTVITCEACHNAVASNLTAVTFPSGATIADLGPQARCMECHQGRASTLQVNQSIANAGLEGEEDTVGEDLGFTNIHYFAAAATQYGTLAMGGYEYEGKPYDAQFDHVAPYDTCVDCHNPHTLEIRYEECTSCHTNLRQPEDLLDIRMEGSLVDYDGDGNMDEGVFYEIEDMRTILYGMMQSYAAEVAGTPIVYDELTYPYFFIDTNANGEADADEVAFPNSFNAWTPRLAKAAYNYQVSLKDPGRYAHGGKYIIQLLYDSIEDLNGALAEPVDVSALNRIDHGHFAGSEEAFRHWDEDGAVPGTCSKCHSAGGLPFFLTEGVTVSQPPANGLNCATCHSDVSTFELYQVEQVEFPSGLTVSVNELDLESNVCLNCHQGRESTVSVNNQLEGLEDDAVAENLRFQNVHYFAAGATLFGTEAKGAYEYSGQTYVGRFTHVGAFDTCTECHSTHALQVRINECAECHVAVEANPTLEGLREIRIVDIDYDGDGVATEGIANEIQTMQEMLYDALQQYATNTVGTGIVYDSNSHPYYFVDSNGNGEPDPDEINSDNRYVDWTPRLLRAAYNYQYVQKDPGAFAHNGVYIVQILYDALNDIGADTSGMTRPASE
ncbi:MAG TPA: hypothetical protein VF177_07375 [Anaerolineae bacterium]